MTSFLLVDKDQTRFKFRGQGDGFRLALMKMKQEKAKKDRNPVQRPPVSIVPGSCSWIALRIVSRATGSGCAVSSPATALGIQIVENCDRKSSRRPMEARFGMSTCNPMIESPSG